MCGSQMISIFSLINGLYTIWNALNLADKLKLWFGSGNKQFLSIYHKVALWNQAGWDKRTLGNIPKLK